MYFTYVVVFSFFHQDLNKFFFRGGFSVSREGSVTLVS